MKLDEKKNQKYALCGHVHTGNHNITACPVYDYVFQEEKQNGLMYV